MEEKQVSRRDFLQTAAVGVALAAMGSALPTMGKPDAEPKKMAIFVCSVCGHVEFGAAPDVCPVCHAPKEQFKSNDTLFSANEAKFKELGISHTPVLAVKKESTLITEQPCGEALVRVGKKLHPMEEKHSIRWMDCYSDDKWISRIFLTIGVEPAAGFYFKNPGSKIRIVSWCNLHGYWQAEA
jgi:superoxide reductase